MMSWTCWSLPPSKKRVKRYVGGGLVCAQIVVSHWHLSRTLTDADPLVIMLVQDVDAFVDRSRLSCQLRLWEEHDGLEVKLPESVTNMLEVPLWMRNR